MTLVAAMADGPDIQSCPGAVAEEFETKEMATMSKFKSKTPALLALACMLCAPLMAEMRVAQPDAMRAVVKKVQPEYNPIARQMRVQGEVEVEAHVSDAGDVTEVKVLSGNALLTATVVKAVKDWRFQPFQDNGKPSQAIATLRFTFKL
jgi:TonB family protein